MTYDGGRIWCPACREERPETEFRVVIKAIPGQDWTIRVWRHACHKLAYTMQPKSVRLTPTE